MSFWMFPESPSYAWSTYKTYSDEVDRGIVHTEKWTEEMKELREKLEQTLEDLRFLGQVEQRHKRLRPNTDPVQSGGVA